MATIPGEGAFMKNSVTRGFTAALRRVNRSMPVTVTKRPQDCRYDQLEVTSAYELDRVFGARDRSQPRGAAGQGS